jgi:glutathione S-transferase
LGVHRVEEATAARETRLGELRASFEPVRATLQGGRPFLSGDAPGYADYIVAGFLVRLRHHPAFFRSDDALLPWFGRVRDLHGGLELAASMIPARRRASPAWYQDIRRRPGVPETRVISVGRCVRSRQRGVMVLRVARLARRWASFGVF